MVQSLPAQPPTRKLEEEERSSILCCHKTITQELREKRLISDVERAAGHRWKLNIYLIRANKRRNLKKQDGKDRVVARRSSRPRESPTQPLHISDPLPHNHDNPSTYPAIYSLTKSPVPMFFFKKKKWPGITYSTKKMVVAEVVSHVSLDPVVKLLYTNIGIREAMELWSGRYPSLSKATPARRLRSHHGVHAYIIAV